jgi:GNAT superfamily N-acetyltransferase
MTDLQIRPFDRRLDRSAFQSGSAEMDHWLRLQAGQQEGRNNTRTSLAVFDGRIIGYYCTLTTRLDLDEAAAAFGVGRRRYPIPAVLLARLAVDQSAQAQGFGARLLLDGIQRLAMASESIGFELVVVDAIDQSASTFYREFGFQTFIDSPLHLFMMTKDLRKTFVLDETLYVPQAYSQSKGWEHDRSRRRSHKGSDKAVEHASVRGGSGDYPRSGGSPTAGSYVLRPWCLARTSSRSPCRGSHPAADPSRDSATGAGARPRARGDPTAPSDAPAFQRVSLD